MLCAFPEGPRLFGVRTFHILLPKGQDKSGQGLASRLLVRSSVNASLPCYLCLHALLQICSPPLCSLPLAPSSPAPSLLPSSSPSSIVVRSQSAYLSQPRGPTSPSVRANIRCSLGTISKHCICCSDGRHAIQLSPVQEGLLPHLDHK